jgi:saccharopine dehydrogenase-like NADP-dependent oxidoreductase
VARSAIQITTASGICAMLDMLANGVLPQRGFIRQEEVALSAFLSNRFGSAFGGHDLAPTRRAA